MRSKRETEFAQRKWPYVIFWRADAGHVSMVERMGACRCAYTYTTVALYACAVAGSRGRARGRRRHTVREKVGTTQDSLGRSVAFHPPTSPPTIEALFRPDAGPGAEDADLRDRSAPDVCPIAILRGLLL